MTTHRPIIITPQTRATLQEIQRLHETAAAMNLAEDILSSHQDPVVRLAVGKLKPAIRAWVRDADEMDASMVSDTGTDEITLALSQHEAIVLGRSRFGGVTINSPDDGVRIEIMPVSTDLWNAYAPMPEWIQLSDATSQVWGWRLNGKVIEPRTEVTVTAGDVIEVERARITLEGAPA